MKHINIIGNKYNRWTVISYEGVDKKRNGLWKCSCECGNIKIVRGYTLTGNTSKSCGCFNKEQNITNKTRHGFSKRGEISNFYMIFFSLKGRCNNPNNKKYGDYGGRGIKNEWHSFEEFKDDMHASYQKHISKFGKDNTSLDRINNNGNYTKQNCQWSTWIQQANNRRKRIIKKKMAAHIQVD